VYFTVGTHPHNAHEELDVTAGHLVELATHPKCVGIGEAGLDYYYDNSPRDAQAQGFAPTLLQHVPQTCRWSFTHAMQKATPPKSSKTKWAGGLSSPSALLFIQP
jgi:hypothetical protein